MEVYLVVNKESKGIIKAFMFHETAEEFKKKMEKKFPNYRFHIEIHNLNDNF